MILKILINYLILFVCVAGFAGGAVIVLILPVIQVLLSCFNFCWGNKWQTVLMLEVHLFISTVVGLYLEGYLYLRYISNDAESVLIFQEMIKIGAIFVLGIGIITTVLKLFLAKRN